MQRKSKDTKPKNRKGGPSKGAGAAKSRSRPAAVKQQSGAPRKAWAKGQQSKNDDHPSLAARGALKPVEVKLEKHERDIVLDILHQLHVAGMDDVQDGNDTDEGDGLESDEGENDDEGALDDKDSGDMFGGYDSEEDEEDEEQSEDDEFREYDGTFAKMANIMSGLVINETELTDDDLEANAGTEDGKPERDSSIAHTTAQDTATRPKGKRLGPSGGPGSSSQSPPDSARIRKQLLATMVAEDRKQANEEPQNRVPTDVVEAAAMGASSLPRASWKGKNRRQEAAGGGGGGKVRLEVCTESKKTGAPDVKSKKMMVFDRSESIETFMETCRSKLHMRKKARGAALLEGEEVVDWLSDLTWVPNGAVVFIAATAAPAPKKGKTPPGVSAGAAGGASREDRTGKKGSEQVPPEAAAAVTGASASGSVGAKRTADEDEEEAVALAALDRIRQSYKRRAKTRASTPASGDGAGEERAGKLMLEKRRAVESTGRFRGMMAQRQKLPAYSQREEIVKMIHENQVIVLSGETGCGKTTQVPQFVLDSFVSKGDGGRCNIVCTQPRRISAVGVAERVADERCEAIGGTVGYQIRLESKVGPSTRLTFCTTGILLRRLTSDEMLADVSHIMVDEVHERDLQTDFLLVILRDLLGKRPDLRVVLMSATLQADLFTRYFNNCPAINIPGRTFPVEIHFLDSINRMVRGSKTPALMPRVSGSSAGAPAMAGRGHAGGRGAARGRGAGSGSRGSRSGGSQEEDAPAVEYDPLTGEPLDPVGLGSENPNRRGRGRGASPGGVPTVSPKCEDKLDYELVVDLVDHIMVTEGRGSANVASASASASAGGAGRGRGQDGRQVARRDRKPRGDEGGEPLGAILVFLPGFAEIDQVVKALCRHQRIGRAARVFPLHSTLPSHQQRAIFQRMPPGVRKIVVSTNIAETSVTIDDCTHVIDAGRVREMRYDPGTRMSCLVEVWISKASGSQRAGRAGRVRPGQCWRLYPEAFHEMYMPSHTLAEMLRTPLEDLVLQVLLLELGSPAEFLGKAIERPPPKMIRAALQNLYELQAIIIVRETLRPILTPLGYHLALLPMDARVGKLLIVGAILQCLDPILTIAAALSYKSPFQRPFGEQGMADAARARFAQYKSDHLAIVEAFGAWRNRRRICSRDEMWTWCRENFLSLPTLEMLDGLREQFRQQLTEVGFATAQVPGRRAAARDSASVPGAFGGGVAGAAVASSGDGGIGSRDPDRNAGHIALVQSALCAGLYPNVAAFVRPDQRRETKKGHFVTRDDAEPVFMHPTSVNHQRFANAAASGRQVWVAYHSKMKTTKVYIHDSTYATPFSLMLWGPRIRHYRPEGRSRKKGIHVIVDGWLRFRMEEGAAVAFKALRRELSNFLVGKIEDPSADAGPLSGSLVDSLGRLLDIEARCS